MSKMLSVEVLNNSGLSYASSDIDEVFGDALLKRVINDTNRRVHMLCDPNELTRMGSVRIEVDELGLVMGAADPHPSTDTGLPARIFFGAGRDDEDLHLFGTLEGTQAYGVPFIGYIETAIDKRRSGLASKFIPILDHVTKAIYEMPLTSGPDYYLSPNGRALQSTFATRNQLRTNEQGFVEAS